MPHPLAGREPDGDHASRRVRGRVAHAEVGMAIIDRSAPLAAAPAPLADAMLPDQGPLLIRIEGVGHP